MEHTFKQLDWQDKSINIDAEHLHHFCFAEDMAITTDKQGDAQELLEDLKQVAATPS